MWTSIKSAFINYVIPWIKKPENQALVADLAKKGYEQISKK